MKKITSMTDEELAVCYMEGNNQAFDLLLSRYQEKLFSYIMFFVGDESLADDLFQESFVKIIVRLQHKQYSPTGKFSAWCIRIAHNVVMDWFRLRRSARIVDQPNDNDLSALDGKAVVDSSIENVLIDAQVLNDVKKLMSFLPAAQREVVFMRFYQGMSFKEIAESTRVSINTALGRMRYAIINMRRLAKTHGLQLDVRH
ncbi:MAG: RNA polymerase sigma factor [Prevotella sp.]